MSEQQTASTFLHQQLQHTQELASRLAAFIKLSISCQFGCSAHKASPCIQVNWALVPCKCTCREQAWHSATAKTWAGPQAQAGQLAGAAQPAGTTTASSASPAALPALPHLVGPCGWCFLPYWRQYPKPFWNASHDEFVVQAFPFWFYSTESYFACAVVDL